MKVLFIGEIVGKTGVFCVKKMLPDIKKQYGIDFVIANGEGATGGFGIGKNHSIYLRKLGIDVITSGECIYYKKDMVDYIETASFILRPLNYPHGNPGRGWRIYTRDNFKIAVINILGLYGFDKVHLNNPFIILQDLVERISQQTPIIIVDFHASATAEKRSMFFHLAGKVSAVIGTHTKAITADEEVMPEGTAIITDAGRTGSLESVGGLNQEIEIRKYLRQIHEYSKPASSKLELQGVVIEIDLDGKARAITRLREACKEEYKEKEHEEVKNHD
ncbi:MAG: YmdB family metallophosphoesterase [Spirochaetales bacterium]|nr:YmdB family metallophosphoesterase [Spirochaetales bacterium]